MRKKLQLFYVIALSLVTSFGFGQTMSITGKVSDGDGSALYGVNVTVKGTTRGTISNDKGVYTISAAKGETLAFSYIGFAPQNVVIGNQTSINVSLVEDANTLGEVVVTAFGIEKDKKSLGYSVTQVDGDKFTESRTNNLGAGLTGKIAGVNVSAPTTGAAGSSRVVIRGGSSLSGNDQPLYVINGVPMDNSNLGNAGMWGGNDNGDGLASINPDDIENISVLKGNTASALYGSRASNGVILITTKTGAGTKGLGVNFNSNYTMDRAWDLTDLQNQFGTGTLGEAPSTADEALDFGNSSWGAPLDGSQVIQFDGVQRPYSDVGENINDFYRTGNTWTNTLALSGSNDMGSFRFSAADLNNQDVMPNSGFDRTTFNANINGTYGKFDLAVSGQYTLEGSQNRPRLSDTPGNANFAVVTRAPNIPFSAMQGDPNKLGALESNGFELRHQANRFSTNPYWAAYQFERLDAKNRLFGNVSLTYNITDWLYVRGRLGTDILNGRFESSEAYGTAYKEAGSLNVTNRQIREDNQDLFIGVNKQFGEISVDALVGGNRMRRTNESTRVGGDGLNIPFFNSLTNVAQQTYGYGLSELGINSVFGSANIGYGNFLFLNLTGRQDQYSVLSQENNSIFYPSVGVSFAFSDIIENRPNWLTFGKARVSWAQVGGGDPAPYSNNLTYGLRGFDHAGAILGNINNGSIPNSNLSPFLSTEIEFGLDMRFLQNRVGLDFAVYQRRTVNDILNTSISATSGFGSTQVNIGELTNNGVEVLLTGTPIKNKDFRWDVSLNFARNISNVVNLGTDAAGENIEFVNLDESRARQERIRHYVGEQLGVIAGFEQQQLNGQPVYDENGFPERADDFSVLALGRHPIAAGLSNEFSYKNFSLSFLIDMRNGGSMMSGTNLGLNSAGLHQETVPGRLTGLEVSGVNQAGEPQTWQIAPDQVQQYWTNYRRITNNFIYDASFAKLRELSIGYNLPGSLLKNTPITNLRLSAVGRNLALLWSNVPNIDPESGYTASGNSQGLEYFSMPSVRNLGFNLSASF